MHAVDGQDELSDIEQLDASHEDTFGTVGTVPMKMEECNLRVNNKLTDNYVADQIEKDIKPDQL